MLNLHRHRCSSLLANVNLHQNVSFVSEHFHCTKSDLWKVIAWIHFHKTHHTSKPFNLFIDTQGVCSCVFPSCIRSDVWATAGNVWDWFFIKASLYKDTPNCDICWHFLMFTHENISQKVNEVKLQLNEPFFNCIFGLKPLWKYPRLNESDMTYPTAMSQIEIWWNVVG